MKNGFALACVFLFMFGLAAVALAAQDAAVVGVTTNNATMSWGDWKTYTGIAVMVTGLVGFIKKLWPAFAANKERFIAMGLAVGIGIVAKLLGAFDGPKSGGESWINHIIALVMAGIGSGYVHDDLVNPFLKGKETVAAPTALPVK